MKSIMIVTSGANLMIIKCRNTKFNASTVFKKTLCTINLTVKLAVQQYEIRHWTHGKC